MKKIVAIIAFCLIVIAGAGATQSGTQDVYTIPDLPFEWETIIAEETDCNRLSGEFTDSITNMGTVAARQGDNETADGAIDALDAIEWKLEQLGC